MIEVSVLVPLADNAGAAFPPAAYADLEAFLVQTFGGFTLLPQTAGGGWIDAAGIYYPDRHRVYVVALSTITEGGRVGTLADFVKARFAQLNVYVRYLMLAEIL